MSELSLFVGVLFSGVVFSVVCAALPLWDVSTVVSHFTCQVCSTGWVRPAPLAGRGQGRCHEASSWLDWGRPCTGRSARPSEPHVEPPVTCSRHILYLETCTSNKCSFILLWPLLLLSIVSKGLEVWNMPEDSLITMSEERISWVKISLGCWWF